MSTVLNEYMMMMRCHLAATLMVSDDTLLDGVPNPQGKGE